MVRLNNELGFNNRNNDDEDERRQSLSSLNDELNLNNRTTDSAVSNESGLNDELFSDDDRGIGMSVIPDFDAFVRNQQDVFEAGREEKLERRKEEIDITADSEFEAQAQKTALNTQEKVRDVGEFLDPTQSFDFRPLFATEDRERDIPYGGPIANFAISATPRIIEGLSTVSVQVTGGLERGFQGLIAEALGEELPEDTTELPDVQIGEADLSDASRFGVNEWLGEWDTGEEGNKIPGPGKVMVDSFDKYEEENPDQTAWNIAKAVTVGPVATATEALFAGLDIQDLARYGIKRTGGDQATQRALDVLGISQDNVSPSVVREQFQSRLDNILNRHSGAIEAGDDPFLTTRDQIDINEVGNAAATLAEKARGGNPVPELNNLGRFVRKISQIILDNVTGPSRFRGGRPRGSQLGLPGQRSRPGQARPAGLSVEEFENVGGGSRGGDDVGGGSRGGDDVPTPPRADNDDIPQPSAGAGRQSVRVGDDVSTPPRVDNDDIPQPSAGAGRQSVRVGGRSIPSRSEIQVNDPLSDIDRIARQSDSVEDFRRNITEDSETDISRQRVQRLRDLSESYDSGGRSQLDQDYPNITGEDVDAPNITQGTIVPKRPDIGVGDAEEVRSSGLVDIFADGEPQAGDVVSTNRGDIDSPSVRGRRVRASNVREMDGELVYAPESTIDTYSRLDEEDFYNRISNQDTGAMPGMIDNPLGSGQAIVGNAFSRGGQMRLEIINPRTGELIDSVPVDEINPRARTRTDEGQIENIDEDIDDPFGEDLEEYKRSIFKEGAEGLPEGENIYSGIPSVNKTRLGDERMENIEEGMTHQEAQYIEPDLLTPPEVEHLKNELYNLEKDVLDDPARNLSKYVNQDGEIPEIKGYGGKFSKEGEDILDDLNYNSREEAQNAYDQYRQRVEDYNQFKDYVKEVDQVTSLTEKNYSMADVNRAVDEYDVPIQISSSSRQEMLHTMLRDRMARLEYIQQEIREQGARIPESLDAYSEFDLSEGRIQQLLKEEEDYLMDDFLPRLSDSDISLEELDEYMVALHAPKRNSRVNDVTDGRIEDGGSGMTNEEARRLIDRFEREGKREQLEDFKNEVLDNIYQKQRDLMVDYKLYSQDQIDDMHFDDNYVKLSVIQDDDSGMFGGGKGLIKQIKGSRAGFNRRHNVIAQGAVDLMDTIVKGEKNKFALKLKDLAEEFPNEDIWSVEKMQYRPQYNNAGEVVGLEQQRNFDTNEIVAHDGADRYLITINDDAMAKGMKKMNLPSIVSTLKSVPDFMRAAFTYRNPAFMLGSNLPRDIQLALNNVGIDISADSAARIASDIPSAMSAVARADSENKTRALIESLVGDEADPGSVSRLQETYELMLQEGGMMQWADINREVEDMTREMVERIEDFTNNGAASKFRNMKRAFLDFMDSFNNPVEHGVRVAVAEELLRLGYSPQQAARYASDVTVNFRKKGVLAPALDGIFLFFSPATQGTWQTSQFFKSKRGMKWIGGLMALGAGTVALNEQLNPELWDQIDDNEKDQNWILTLPVSVNEEIEASKGDVPYISVEKNEYGYYLKVRKPYIINTILTTGEEVYNVASEGWGRIPKSMERVGSSLYGGVSPISGSTIEQTISPDVADPFIQIMQNETWFGGNVMPEQAPYEPEVPDSQLYYDSVSETSKFVTEWLNDVSGGNTVESGYIDISPESLDHLMESYTGGAGKFFMNTLSTGVNTASGEGTNITDVPFVNDFVGTPFEGNNLNRFYDSLNKSATDQLNSYEEEEAFSNIERAVSSGEISEEDATTLVEDMIENQNRTEAGRVLKDIRGEYGEDNIIKNATSDGEGNVLLDMIVDSGVELDNISSGVEEQLREISSRWIAENIARSIDNDEINITDLNTSKIPSQVEQYLIDELE